MSRQVEDQDPETARKTRQEDENGPEEKRSKTETTRESCLDQPMDSSVVHEVVKLVTHNSQVAKYYDADTTEPIIGGLHSLEELLSWRRSEAQPFNVEPPLSRTPFRTLVSHDMMGGYLDDRFLQGTDSELPYCFYHWNHIDIFNYFTHSMVTIPPAGWTNAAHGHGVLVLGTFITEWTDGGKACEEFLKDEESYRAVADKLVQICHCYGFDGWLVNIENELSASAVKNMPLFLHYLTEQIHERVSGGLVLWYDSVVHTGKLTWQNQLNQNNRLFFDACDGFFTNYNWTEQNLEDMRGFSAVQGRQADVYVGVDVFARGEVVGECTTLTRFWGLLSDHLPLHRPVSSLPFTSSFCQGFGKSFYWRGKRESERSWFHLSAQQFQAELCSSKEGRAWLRTRACPDHVWCGGSSLLLEGLIPSEQTAAAVCEGVLSLHLPLASSTLVCLVYKASAGVSVFLEMSVQEPNEDKYTCLCGSGRRTRLKLTVCSLCAFDSEHDWTVLLDAYSLHLPSERVEGLCIYDVAWLPGSSEEPLLNATLRWSFRAAPACHYRVHWRRLRGPDPRTTAGPVRLVSRAYSQVFRVTELAVPRPPALLELLVEPVLKSGFVLPESQWGRARLSYNSDHTQGL
ncbi:hypothetical protein WMY93_006110 [Mugilogobius chulae]|uniref:Cytosolic endo-beta-N-acetylglucosaminidase n=1 Tax=Mugilogobius chulae TaxID=88201 RepID=A0AAW0PIQ1_9GOBI